MLVRIGDCLLIGECAYNKGRVLFPAFVYMRSRTYNIRIEDHILVKFTPRNPSPTYFLGDVVRRGRGLGGLVTHVYDTHNDTCI